MKEDYGKCTGYQFTLKGKIVDDEGNIIHFTEKQVIRLDLADYGGSK